MKLNAMFIQENGVSERLIISIKNQLVWLALKMVSVSYIGSVVGSGVR